MLNRRHIVRVTLATLILILSGSAPSAAQSAHPITGRPIGNIMGVGGADWLDRTEREIEELPEIALNAIGIRPGITVADVGAGSGYFTVRLAKRVGPEGKVLAVDVQPEMISMVRARAEKDGFENIEPILGSGSDPKLPKGSVDLILMVDVYHELAQPQRMLRRMREALKPDGRLVMLEYRKEDPYIPIRSEHKMSIEEARLEVEAEGFKLERVLPDLPRQHIFVFRKDG